MTTSELIPSLSIENLVARRDAVVARIRDAHRLLTEVDASMSESVGEAHGWWHGYTLSLQFSSGSHAYFTDERGVERATRKVDAAAWSFLLDQSGLRSFLDATARAKWREAIDKEDVPELTVANVAATFELLFKERSAMFERGVVEVFRKLSWDFKTNNPVKFGRRLVLKYLVDTSIGGDPWPSHAGCDKLDDLVRVMSVLDGKPEPDHRHGSWRALKDAGWCVRQRDVALHGLFSVRGFKNGNAHLTFLREDLVDAMNRILAKHHPNALPPES